MATMGFEYVCSDGLFYGSATSCHRYPAEDSKHGTDCRSYDHDPEIAPCGGIENGGTEATGRVDGAIVDRNTYDVYQAEGETDGKTGEFSEAFGRIGGTEYD